MFYSNPMNRPNWNFNEPGPSKRPRLYNPRYPHRGSHHPRNYNYGPQQYYGHGFGQHPGYSGHRFDQPGNYNQRPQQWHNNRGTYHFHNKGKPDESKILTDPLKFEKRGGTTNLGKLYEDQYPAFVILKLLRNKEVNDFCISADDKNFGAFDDFILELDFKNASTEKYAIQLKHKGNFTLTVENLKEDKNFCILNYYQTFQNCGQLLSDFKVILFTNANFTPENNIVVDLGNEVESVKIRIIQCNPSFVINTSESGKSYQFQLEPQNSETIKQKYKKFFEQFFLYVNQMNVHQLEQDNIPQSFGMLTRSPVVDKYLKFISKWSLLDGIKDKLTKDMMMKVVTLYIVEELIQPHTFCDVNEEKKFLQTAISYFNVTAFNTDFLENIVTLWGDAKDVLRDRKIEEINEKIRRYQISTKENIQNIDDLTDDECTKLLWVMNICPLILKDHPAAYEAANLCGEKSKFVFITDDLDDEKLQQLSVFKTLSDLKRHESTYNIINKISFSLFQEKTNLENLIKEDNAFEDLVTTNEIVKITGNSDIIKLKEEELCFPYVERYLYKNIIDFKYLQNLNKNTLVLISNVENEKKLREGLQNFEFVSIMDELYENTDDTTSSKKNNIRNADTSMEEFNTRFEDDNQNLGVDSINEYRDNLQIEAHFKKDKTSKDSSSKKYTLFFKRTEASPEEFKKLCDKQKKYQKFHHFKYHDVYLEWIKSIGDVSDLQKFCVKDGDFVKDEKLCAENISNNVNIVGGDPGMGKSVFVKKLKNSLLYKYFTVLIEPKEIRQLCRSIKNSKNLEQLFTFILQSKFSNFGNFETRVFELLLKKGKAVFLWDALDEMTEQNRVVVEKLISTLSKNSVAQFLTTRGFLRKQLEDKFNVLSQELQPFNQGQQRNYIQNRLQDICSGEELDSITTAIIENIADISYREILGIPLQIYMLTELFRQDLEKYKKLFTELFVITDLYSYFIEEKIKFHLKKQKPELADDYEDDIFLRRTIWRRRKNYQQIALKSLFGTLLFKQSSIELDDLLNEIKTEGDEFGFITAVDINMQSEFLHNSYAEYFAAIYLAENCRNIPDLKNVLFERRYTNVRYFFDTLLAKECPVHIAVLCKNLRYLQYCKDEGELKKKDLQGRNALHLTASWGERYPLLETSETSDIFLGPTILIHDDINFETKKENLDYHEIIKTFLMYCDPHEEDQLFNLTPTMYAEKCECLFAAAFIQKRQGNKYYLNTKNEKFVYSLLYYAIKYGFNNILDLFANIKFALIQNGSSLLHIAVENNQLQYLNKLLEWEVYKQNINYENEFGETPLVIASSNGFIETVKCLIQENANINAADSQGQTPLYLAALNGHLETVKYLKQQNAKVDGADEKGFTPLMVAAENGHLETVKYLIQQNAKVDASNKDGSTPLMIAAQNGHLETVKYLKQQNAKLDAADIFGFTPLMVAAQNGHLETVKYLIKEGANVNAAANQGQTSLHLAALKGHLEIVKYLMQQNVKVDGADEDDFTPLMNAAENGHLETVKYLKEQNANVNAKNKDGFTPLMMAAQNGHVETVEYLIEQSADVNAAANEGQTPLHLAALKGHLETVKYLVRQNAEADAANIFGSTPLMIAARNGLIETVKFLVKQNAIVNAAANTGETPLYLSAFNGHLETVKYLMQQNAKVDAANKDGFTPLRVATENGHLETVKYLREQNAKVDAADEEGFTPLMVAAENGHLEIVKYLKEQNAKVDARNMDGGTPLMIAAQSGRLETVEYLIEQSANVNAAANQGQTPLYLAALEGHLETVKYLKRQNAIIDAETDNGFTPLMKASQNGHLETVKYLVEESANVNAAAIRGETPLYLAASKGHLEIVKYLQQQNAKIDIVDEDGFTPLMITAQNGHLETVTYLIQQSANVNAAANQGETPLYLAAYNGHLETVKYLKQHNAKVDAADKNGVTPLMLAAQNGHIGTVNYFIHNGANINATASDGMTLLWSAAYGGLLETVSFLLEQNLDVDATDGDGLTPLMAAAQEGHLSVVQLLITSGARIDVYDKHFETPLTKACKRGDEAVVEFLIKSGASVNFDVEDTENRPTNKPLHVACANGHKKIVEILLQAGADFETPTIDGRTCVDLAIQNEHEEIAELLQSSINNKT